MLLVVLLLTFALKANADGLRLNQISLRIINTSAALDWNVTICDNADTIFKSRLLNDTITIALGVQRTYYINCYRRDTNANTQFLVRSEILGRPELFIICTNTDARTSSSIVNAYSARYVEFLNSLNGKIRLFQPAILDEELSGLKVDIEQLALLFCKEIPKDVDCTHVVAVTLSPVLEYIDHLIHRWRIIQSFQNRTEIANPFLVDSINSALEHTLLDDMTIDVARTEAYLLYRKIAYSVAMNTPRWLRKLYSNMAIDSKATVEVASVTVHFLGRRSICEAAYGLFQINSSNLGESFATCSEPFPAYLLDLASRDTTYFCKRMTMDMIRMCEALEVTLLESIDVMDANGKSTTLLLNPDSIYVLHFWGTWCGPCLKQHDDIMLVADSLDLTGCTMIHLAYEDHSQLPIWKTFIKSIPRNQFLIENTALKTTVIDRLYVSSYPSYVIIRPGNKVGARIYKYSELTTAVR